jgi:hypothetical protein
MVLSLPTRLQNAEVEVIEPAHIEVQERGGVYIAALPVCTKDTACVKLIGATERAATTKPKALEAWSSDEAGHWQYVAL